MGIRNTPFASVLVMPGFIGWMLTPEFRRHLLTYIPLDTLLTTIELDDNGEFEEAKEVYERCLAGRMKALGEDHTDALDTLSNLGVVFKKLGNYEKALEYYERALKGNEKTLEKTHPDTLDTVMNIALLHEAGLMAYGKAEELYQRALSGYEAQLGKDNDKSKKCARNFVIVLENAKEKTKLKKILDDYLHLLLSESWNV
ncbi:hypothetical protein TL16_g02355 [Triparma laevis f. inornata]|uniref:Kinesin light chain n=1 Tax=Triparma laevis f. inornata TaxID=1714386 RepID=A0A9W6ZWV0_9STRA|nr:hypothetical protein TL16_g02355 [Triparma laevis f. inornata]